MNVPIIGGAIVVGLALLNDPGATIKLATTIITVRGGAWLCTKITTIDKNASEIINFTGWSLAGVAIVKLLNLSIKGLPEILAKWQEIEIGFRSVGQWIENVIPW
jgi:hypothetical protein